MMITADVLLDTITAPLLADPSFPPGWAEGFLRRQRQIFEDVIARVLLPLLAPPSAAPAASLPSLTELERDVILNGFGRNDFFQGGSEPIWSSGLLDSTRLVRKNQIGGVTSSLAQKGLLQWMGGEGWNSSVALTPAGLDVLRALQAQVQVQAPAPLTLPLGDDPAAPPPPRAPLAAPSAELRAKLRDRKTVLSHAQMESLGWERTDPRPWTKLSAFWRHRDGWTLQHCGHPTALYPWTLTDPQGRVHGTGMLNDAVDDPRKGSPFPNLAQAARYVLEKGEQAIAAMDRAIALPVPEPEVMQEGAGLLHLVEPGEDPRRSAVCDHRPSRKGPGWTARPGKATCKMCLRLAALQPRAQELLARLRAEDKAPAGAEPRGPLFTPEESPAPPPAHRPPLALVPPPPAPDRWWEEPPTPASRAPLAPPAIEPPPPPPPAEPAASSAAAALAALGLTVTEELTTPKREGKKPRPVWVVRGTVREQAPVMKAAGGRWWAGAWSYYDDPTERLSAAFQGLPAPPPALREPGARPAAPVASQGPPPAPARAPVPPGVFVPEVYRRVLSLPLDDLPVNDTLKRYSGMTEITAAVRALFKSLGLPEVRAKLTSGGGHARVEMPDLKAPAEMTASYWDGRASEADRHNHPLWPAYRLRSAAEKRVDQILDLAFPNLRDKSDSRTDYFNFVFTSGFYDPTPQTKGDTSIADPDALQPAAAPARPAPAAPRPLGDSDRAARAAKLRELAASAQKEAEKKRGSGLYDATPTHRRAGIIARLEHDAEHLELLRGKVLALADALEGHCEPAALAGCLPGSLDAVDSRALLEALMKGGEVPVPLMYGADLAHLVDKAKGKKGLTLARAALEDLAETCRERACPVTTPSRLEAIEKVARALPGDYAARKVLDQLRAWRRAVAAGLGTEETWKQAVADVAALGKAAPVQAPVERWIRDAERALIGKKIPGYFPTPPALVKEMIDEAELQPGDRVLEPSAGKGDLALAIRAAGAEPDVLEVITDLRDILELKGLHLVGRDFLSYEPGPVYDAVIMNPPFEDLADIDHVRHAYEVVKPGGRVVAITSEAPYYRREKKAQDYRTWLEQVGAADRKNPDKAFMDSDRPTGVSTRLVVIHKRTA